MPDHGKDEYWKNRTGMSAQPEVKPRVEQLATAQKIEKQRLARVAAFLLNCPLAVAYPSLKNVNW